MRIAYIQQRHIFEIHKVNGTGERRPIMQAANSFLVQNVVGRITHGLIGLDIFLNEKRSNDYLEDFLTLEEEEIKEALATASLKTGLIPTSPAKLSEEEEALILCVAKTKRLISTLEKAGSEEDVEKAISELGVRLDVIYRAMLRK